MYRNLSRRKRLLVSASAAGVLFLLAVVVLVVLRPGPVPYTPGERVVGVQADLAREVPSGYPQVVFEDVTREVGITFQHFHGVRSVQLPEDYGSGAAWGDYDNDGWLDLYVANEVGPLTLSAEERAASPARNTLYRNNQNGTFIDVTDRAGVGYRGWGIGVAWGDYDNDGDLDLFASNYGENILYHNDGDGTFSDVAVETGLSGMSGFWAGGSWADYDRDGDLDLYVCGYVQYRYTSEDTTKLSQQYRTEIPSTLNPSSYPPERNLLYRNNGDGTFSEVSRPAGVDNPTGRSLSAAWCDFDGDGWPDLYVANDVSDNVLFHNRGDGSFEDISHSAWVADYRGAMGLATGDWDCDGDIDLFVTHWIAQENALYTNLRSEYALAGIAEAGPMHFMDEADRYGLGQIALDYIGWGTSFFDYDNDGRPDLFVVNGSTFSKKDDPARLIPMRDQLFWNRGRAGFYDVSRMSGAALMEETVGRGAAFGDYDNDGDLDIFVVNNGGPGRLLRNDGGNTHHWLKVRLRGTASNRFGVGAKLRAVSSGSVQIREVGAQSSYCSQNSVEEEFGLGTSERADTLEIIWPSGARQVLVDLPVDRTIEVVEGEFVADDVQRAPSQADKETIRRFWGLYRRATALRAQGKWDEAAGAYREALRFDTRHEDVLYYLGNVLSELGRYDEAFKAWQTLLEVSPHSSRVHIQIGNLHLRPDLVDLFDLKAAEAAFNRALEINGEETGPLLRLGEVALIRGDLDRAWNDFSTVVRSNYRSVEAHYLRGYIRWHQGDGEAALELFRKSVRYSRPEKPIKGVLGEGDTKPGAMPSPGTPGTAHRSLLRSFWAALDRWEAERVSSAEMDVEYRKLREFLKGIAEGRVKHL